MKVNAADIPQNKKILVAEILGQTLKSLFYPQVFLLLFLPLLISIIFVSVTLWLTWGFWAAIFNQGLIFVDPFLQTFFSSLPLFIIQIFQLLSPLVSILLFLAALALAFPVVMIFNLALTSLLSSRYLAYCIASRDFPDLQQKGRPRMGLSMWITLRSSFLYLLIWLLTLPLWLIPLVQLVLPILLTGWLNRQICTFTALTDFANDEEIQSLELKTASQGYILGLITAGFNYIPFAVFFSPILTLIAFIYLELGYLQLGRQAATEASAEA